MCLCHHRTQAEMGIRRKRTQMGGGREGNRGGGRGREGRRKRRRRGKEGRGDGGGRKEGREKRGLSYFFSTTPPLLPLPPSPLPTTPPVRSLSAQRELRGNERGGVAGRNSIRIVLTHHIYFLSPCFTLLFYIWKQRIATCFCNLLLTTPLGVPGD